VRSLAIVPSPHPMSSIELARGASSAIVFAKSWMRGA
jgi:hypothetical protein